MTCIDKLQLLTSQLLIHNSFSILLTIIYCLCIQDNCIASIHYIFHVNKKKYYNSIYFYFSVTDQQIKNKLAIFITSGISIYLLII